MRVPFLKRKHRDEPSHVHVKKKKAVNETPDQKRLQRESDYQVRLDTTNLRNRRSYGAKQQ